MPITALTMFFKSNGFQSLLHQFINTIIGHNYFVKYWLAGPDKVNKWLNRPTTHIIAGKLGANLKKWLPLGEIMFELHTIAEWINFVQHDKHGNKGLYIENWDRIASMPWSIFRTMDGAIMTFSRECFLSGRMDIKIIVCFVNTLLKSVLTIVWHGNISEN